MLEDRGGPLDRGADPQWLVEDHRHHEEGEESPGDAEQADDDVAEHPDALGDRAQDESDRGRHDRPHEDLAEVPVGQREAVAQRGVLATEALHRDPDHDRVEIDRDERGHHVEAEEQHVRGGGQPRGRSPAGAVELRAHLVEHARRPRAAGERRRDDRHPDERQHRQPQQRLLLRHHVPALLGQPEPAADPSHRAAPSVDRRCLARSIGPDQGGAEEGPMEDPRSRRGRSG